jgi:hypothetical protein
MARRGSGTGPVKILADAMHSMSMSIPELTVKIGEIQERKKQQPSNRSTVYRMFARKTTRLNPSIVNAAIEVLCVSEAKAKLVRRGLR